MESAPAREYGRAHVRIVSHADLFEGIADETEVWMSHGDQVPSVSGEFYSAGRNRHLPYRGDQASQLADLRLAISSGSDAHAAGHEDPGQFSYATFAVAPARGG